MLFFFKKFQTARKDGNCEYERENVVGKGVRAYFNIKYRFSERLDFWIKAGNTFWNDRDIISSGYNEIEGKNKTELKFQLRLKM